MQFCMAVNICTKCLNMLAYQALEPERRQVLIHDKIATAPKNCATHQYEDEVDGESVGPASGLRDQEIAEDVQLHLIPHRVRIGEIGGEGRHFGFGHELHEG